MNHEPDTDFFKKKKKATTTKTHSHYDSTQVKDWVSLELSQLPFLAAAYPGGANDGIYQAWLRVALTPRIRSGIASPPPPPPPPTVAADMNADHIMGEARETRRWGLIRVAGTEGGGSTVRRGRGGVKQP